MTKFIKIQKNFIDGVRSGLNNHVFVFLILNFLLTLFQAIYVSLRFKYLNELIPFWYSKPWGNPQLAWKTHIFLIPLLSFLILIACVFLQKHRICSCIVVDYIGKTSKYQYYRIIFLGSETSYFGYLPAKSVISTKRLL